MPEYLTIQGAREHNLAAVDLRIPHGAIVAFAGPSGSGKSSLAFDTIYREAERRFLDSLSPHAMRLVTRFERPDVDQIDGLRAAMALRQRGPTPSARSTVGTLSDLWASLRLLYAKYGEAHCASCDARLESLTPDALFETLTERYGERPFTLLAPLVDGHRGSHRAAMQRGVAAGCQALWIDGEIAPSDPLPELEASKRHRVAARIASFDRGAERSGLRAAMQHALALGEGVLWSLDEQGLERYSIQLGCPKCGAPTQALGTRLFSFQSSYGACASCKGIGIEDLVDPALLVADGSKSLRAGALVPTTPSGYIVYSQVTIDVLDLVAGAHGFSVDDPWDALSQEQQDVIMYGSKRIEVPFGKHPLESRLKWKGITARPRENGHYPGLVPTIEETLKRNRNPNILRFARSSECRRCAGSRLSEHALAVRLGGYSIAHFAGLPLAQLGAELRAAVPPAAGRLLARFEQALDPFLELGLGYLSLQRSGKSLSNGEAQRLRLGTQIGNPLSGMLYVLDEPSVGLHATERDRLYGLLARLRDAGNSVLVVEHDPLCLMRSDWLVRVGPGAGDAGGRVLFSGTPADWLRASEAPAKPLPLAAHFQATQAVLSISGVRANNLQDLDIGLPLGALVAICGVSGAGKSTLLHQVLAPLLRNRLNPGPAREHPGEHATFSGFESLVGLVEVDAAPIGRTLRSNPATYTGLFDGVRELFARLPGAKQLGLKKSHFSFNTKGGRCETCEGAGRSAIGMHGLATQLVPCPSCLGRRFQERVLEVRWQGHSILDVLESSVDQARLWFRDVPRVAQALEALHELGLGYLRLGQPAPTLSGGEAQRVKLARELARPPKGHTLYLLDEPANGLAEDDAMQLLQALRGLVARGHSVIIIEHNTALLTQVDWILDLGPGSGSAGGQLVGEGTPAELSKQRSSPTGASLAAFMDYTSKSAARTPLPPPLQHSGTIRVRGARTHQLKSIDINIEANKLTVLTGPSGSGKSSLAMHTLHAEAQQRFLGSFSSHVRRMLKQDAGASFETLDGLTPCLALGQATPRYGARSTVGTLAHVLDGLRLLFARFGQTPGLWARSLSFLHAEGACPACEGAGEGLRTDPGQLVSKPQLPLSAGALDGSKAGRFYGERGGQHLAILEAVGSELGFDYQLNYEQLSEEARRVAMRGTGQRLWDVQWDFERKGRVGEHRWQTTWKGFCGYVDEEYERKQAHGKGQDLEALMSAASCALCQGERLNSSARATRLGSLRFPEACSLSLAQLSSWLDSPQSSAQGNAELRKTLIERLGRLLRLGLGYLPLDRTADSLSGGEAQRLRLGGRLVSKLSGLSFLLDEPTRGLHASDVDGLLETFHSLIEDGNRVLVVEHNLAVVRAADRVIELGPGAGRLGGQVVFSGTPKELAQDACATGQALRAPLRLSEGGPASGRIAIRGARYHNLRGLDVDLPLGCLLLVSGVSGSGKSSLLHGVLGACVRNGSALNCDSIEGLEDFESVASLDQGALSRQPGVMPMTYLGLLDELRKLYARSMGAREQGLSAKHFSLGSKGGRCEACRGLGRIKEKLDFLGERWLPCPDCGGKRFGSEVLACTVFGLTLPALLELDVATARGVLLGETKLARGLECLEQVGLGYLQLGQGADTLSGGESQRLRLAAELWNRGKPVRGKRLFLLDEPSAGLHPSDVISLVSLFRSLIDAGHSLIVIEHDLGLIAQADHVLDMGPGAGPSGGQVVFSGSPAELARRAPSATGLALKKHAEEGRLERL